MTPEQLAAVRKRVCDHYAGIDAARAQKKKKKGSRRRGGVPNLFAQRRSRGAEAAPAEPAAAQGEAGPRLAAAEPGCAPETEAASADAAPARPALEAARAPVGLPAPSEQLPAVIAPAASPAPPAPVAAQAVEPGVVLTPADKRAARQAAPIDVAFAPVFSFQRFARVIAFGLFGVAGLAVFAVAGGLALTMFDALV